MVAPRIELEREVAGVGATTAPVATEQALAANPHVAAGLKAVGEALREATIGCFREQRDPWGKAWAPLSRASVWSRLARLTRSSRVIAGVKARAAGRGTGRREERAAGRAARARVFRQALSAGRTFTILVDRGVLMNGIHTTVAGLAVELGVGGAAQKYARAQQFGLPGGRRWGRSRVGPLPARAYIPVRSGGEVDLPAALRREIAATLGDALMDALRDQTV